jgi:hypothetical protein
MLCRQREPVVDSGGAGGWGIGDPAVSAGTFVSRCDELTMP